MPAKDRDCTSRERESRDTLGDTCGVSPRRGGGVDDLALVIHGRVFAPGSKPLPGLVASGSC